VCFHPVSPISSHLTDPSPDHMVILFNSCVSPKVWETFPNGSHNDTFTEAGYFEAIFQFMKKVIRGEEVGPRDAVLMSPSSPPTTPSSPRSSSSRPGTKKRGARTLSLASSSSKS